MDPLLLFSVIVVSIGTGVVATLAVQWYVFNRYIKCLPYVGPPRVPMSGHFRLPQSLVDTLQSSDIPKRESCLALNLLFQFLFKELRNAQKVRRWFRHKLSLEFEELLTRTTTGKLFDSVSIRDLCLGTQFPTIKSVSIKDAVLHPQYQHIETLELCLDLEYSGGFQLSIDANLVLGKAAYLSVKVNHLSGQARLQFTRHPYTHWSFSFFGDPVLELEVESQFQGRPLSQITSIIVSQIRKSLKKKHTLPNYKLRYKPFFPKSEPGEEVEEATACPPGNLQVTVIEVTRLMADLVVGDIYCSLAADSTAWVEMVQSETSSFITLDLTVVKNPLQQLGIVFKQEFIVERYQACVLVESVLPQSPASAADVRQGDIVVAVDGKRVTSMAQAARFIKGTGDKFTMRVERQLNFRIQHPESTHKEGQKQDEAELCHISNTDGRLSLPGSPVLGHSGLRHRRGSGDKTESDSSSSSPASMPGSPAKRPSLFCRSSPEHKPPTLSSNKMKDSRSSIDRDDGDVATSNDYLQISKTKEVPHDQIVLFDESLNFQIHENHRYLNVSVWSKSENGTKLVGRGDRDVLLGHISIPLSSIVSECSSTKLGHHIKSYFLLPPEPHMAISHNHKLSGHSGFEPCLCYGDILLSFLYTGQTVVPPSRPTMSPVKPVPSSPQLLLPRPEQSQEMDKKQHDFIRTHFHRTTQCEFCGKKIWLKDAVQCRDCAMTCHKKCVAKCQVGTACTPHGSQRRASALPEDVGQSRGLELLVPPAQARRASAQPEIITTAADDGDRTPQASLVGNPFQFTHLLLDNDAGDDVSAALDHLLQHPNDDDLMSIAKSTGKELYSNLSPPQRKDSINKMISKLKASIDTETQLRMELVQKEQETKDPSEHTRIAFLIGKSDEKVQALAVLMLHFCAGLQHAQDQEEASKKEIDSRSGDDMSMESSQ
ncbi:PDZ domain-containing protein 8 isoform X2 [Zootermopsis nevadensis]|uniref:PDZ domain-containing protein 8 isoform X2 n=1 Tax=Zootermopsis nevadensis TaxID=136037 RepID=UPI000B8E9A39|nr:PDZ domain-containing protein 8 isoform X2 [Zootermopsis nevadensis]